jgi:hypothetical protein
MLNLAPEKRNGAMLRNEVAAYMYDVFSAEDSGLASLDRWTQRRVGDENMAKIALVFEAEDSVEHCYQNLVREIDTEAETGIFLIGEEPYAAELHSLANIAGISGVLHEYMERIAPVMFADELSHSHLDMDIVWVSIQARYDRARIDATVSEMILAHLFEDDASAADISSSLRSLLYPFHEDLTRRLCDLPVVLNERSACDLVMDISELSERAGDYIDRVDAISKRAGTS